MQGKAIPAYQIQHTQVNNSCMCGLISRFGEELIVSEPLTAGTFV
jgi:hypothetical protein